ncbi:hypothetical protein CAPTEDRAFT_157948 [Capitella teleta]|uniref:Tyrosine-protein phosphatase domain-containing protein n=1 Tax=Capitella teleta TaxID=283909 RepID=R7UK83_CAPTE|nr:hypothetical protein CAPTEDRAFT_157948 [Capitella teleta]|eukprot:ELU06954.1 hypothetical protein CAPTEDRAFT_157948 [Capitella teleta]
MDHLLDQASKENGIDVYACVTALRQSRMNMVQSVEQYKFIHLAVLEAHTVGSTNSSAAEFMSLYSALNRRSSVSPQTVFSEQTEILNSISQSPSEEETGIARRAENSKKNRTEILPDNRHLMFLQMPFNERNDYINAVQVPGYKGKDNFVATQWPLEDTVVDFWRLAKDHSVQHIILLEELNGFPKILPESGKTENFGGIDVYCKETEQNDTLVSYTVHFPEDTAEVVYMNTNTEETSFTGQIINVVMLKTPLTNQSIIDVRSKLGLSACSTSTNCTVVCTDGAKLCGLFIAALNILDMVDAENEVDVFYGVQQIKVVRPEFVQSQEQFLQLYDLVKTYLKQKNPSKPN